MRGKMFPKIQNCSQHLIVDSFWSGTVLLCPIRLTLYMLKYCYSEWLKQTIRSISILTATIQRILIQTIKIRRQYAFCLNPRTEPKCSQKTLDNWMLKSSHSQMTLTIILWQIKQIKDLQWIASFKLIQLSTEALIKRYLSDGHANEESWH